jgi:hypothetical protein
MTKKRKHSTIGAGAAIALMMLAASSAASSQLYVHDEGRLHETSYSGSRFHEEGMATGTLPGKLYANFNYTGTSLTVTAQFTLVGNGWSLTGHGTGTLHDANSASPSFSGQATITGGTGRYAYAHANGELYGVFYRRDHYALTVQTLGELHY